MHVHDSVQVHVYLHIPVCYMATYVSHWQTVREDRGSEKQTVMQTCGQPQRQKERLTDRRT